MQAAAYRNAMTEDYIRRVRMMSALSPDSCAMRIKLDYSKTKGSDIIIRPIGLLASSTMLR